MHKDIRRKDRALTEDEALAVLDKCEYGVFSMVNEENEPYAVPISYVVMSGAVYVHCAAAGEKIDTLNANASVCFTVVGNTEPVYDGSFSTYYESCIVFGKARLVTDDAEKRDSLMLLAEKYLPGHMEKSEGYITKSWNRTAVYAIDIEQMTGKAKKRKV
jgi:nitroimidazol reductase NimA-like FMN-containing flavoprotein (pyridoxamine 5'-phosphate oxidase superfamily)